MAISPATFRRPTPSEQLVLAHFQLHVLTEPAELARCDALFVEQHYLRSARFVGEHLRYAATYQGEWLAVLAFCAGSYHLRHRDAFIGWTPAQRRLRLPLVVNNCRLLILPDAHYPNLASRLLSQVLARLSADWQTRWQHPVALVETFVDPERFRGTTYKVSGWRELGATAGYGRSAQDFYEAHERPKQLWVKELVAGAAAQLAAPELQPAWAVVEAAVPAHERRCPTEGKELTSLLTACQGLPEFRRRQALGYPIGGVVALMVLACFCQVTRGQRDLAAFARKLTQTQLRTLGFRCNRHTGRRRCPGETLFQRVLAEVPATTVEAILLRWQAQILGPVTDTLIAIDGKTLCHADDTELVSALGAQTGRWLGTEPVAEDSNEIPAAQKLIDRLDLELDGKLIILDAMHTQTLTAQKIYHERGANYVMTVKANQKTLYATLETKLQTQSFSPSADAGQYRQQTGA